MAQAVVLTTPGTRMTPVGRFGISQVAPFTSLLPDEWYVSSNLWLEWMKRDLLRLSAVTAGFLAHLGPLVMAHVEGPA